MDIEAQQKILKSAVNQLPQPQRDLLTLYIRDDLTCLQIAERLGSTEQIVRSNLVDAYARLLQLDMGKLPLRQEERAGVAWQSRGSSG